MAGTCVSPIIYTAALLLVGQTCIFAACPARFDPTDETVIVDQAIAIPGLDKVSDTQFYLFFTFDSGAKTPNCDTEFLAPPAAAGGVVAVKWRCGCLQQVAYKAGQPETVGAPIEPSTIFPGPLEGRIAHYDIKMVADPNDRTKPKLKIVLTNYQGDSVTYGYQKQAAQNVYTFEGLLVWQDPDPKLRIQDYKKPAAQATYYDPTTKTLYKLQALTGVPKTLSRGVYVYRDGQERYLPEQTKSVDLPNRDGGVTGAGPELGLWFAMLLTDPSRISLFAIAGNEMPTVVAPARSRSAMLTLNKEVSDPAFAATTKWTDIPGTASALSVFANRIVKAV